MRRVYGTRNGTGSLHSTLLKNIFRALLHDPPSLGSKYTPLSAKFFYQHHKAIHFHWANDDTDPDLGLLAFEKACIRV